MGPKGQSPLNHLQVNYVAGMTNFGFWCATALLLLVASSASVSGLLCQDSYETLESFSNRSIAHVHNSSYTVTTQGYEGRASFLSNGTFGLYGFQEANRSTNVKCIEADTFPYIEDKWLAKLFKFIRIGDMNCSSQRYLETVPGTDVQIKTLGFTATLDIYPDLVLSFNISTASAAGNYTFDYPTERVAEYEYVKPKRDYLAVISRFSPGLQADSFSFFSLSKLAISPLDLLKRSNIPSQSTTGPGQQRQTHLTSLPSSTPNVRPTIQKQNCVSHEIPSILVPSA